VAGPNRPGAHLRQERPPDLVRHPASAQRPPAAHGAKPPPRAGIPGISGFHPLALPAGPVALLLDEHPTHTDQASQSLADDLDIRLLWLPNRSPHLNPVDHLW